MLVVYVGNDTNVINPLEFVSRPAGGRFGRKWHTASTSPRPAPGIGVPISTTVPVGTGVAANAADCTDKARMEVDVTVPDNTNMPAGEKFLKTWRLRNTGTCTWTTGYALVYSSGPTLGGRRPCLSRAPLRPKGTIDVSVPLVAPGTNRTSRSKWQLRNANGKVFGIENSRDGTFWVQIVVDRRLPSASAFRAVPPQPRCRLS